MDIKPIKLLRLNEASASEETQLLDRRFALVATEVQREYRARYGGAEAHSDAIVLLAAVREFLNLMARLDADYGADSALPLADAAEATDEALRSLAELESWLDRLQLPDQKPHLHAVALGIGLWAMRHDCQIRNAAPLVNAAAEHANAAQSRQEVAAAFAMMQGLVEFFAPALAADLERSDPNRPWRILNLNLALTAIRSGDQSLMRFAFDKLNLHLPDERVGFYTDALQLAERGSLPDDLRASIREQLERWTTKH